MINNFEAIQKIPSLLQLELCVLLKIDPTGAIFLS